VTDAFEEVEERIREEKMSAAFKRFAPIGAALFVLAVAGIGGWEFWKAQQARTGAAFAAAMRAASELSANGDLTGAAKAYGQLAERGPAGHRALAMMELAGAQVGQGDADAALKSFDKAAELSPDPILRDSARLKAAYIAADKQTLKQVEPRLTPIISGGSVFQFPARELLAMEALEAGEKARAEEQFKFLTSALEAPPCIQWRAELGLFTLGKAAMPEMSPEALARCAGDQPAGAGMMGP
jgi:hypothetical protein